MQLVILSCKLLHFNNFSFLLREQVKCGCASVRFGEWKLGERSQVCCGTGWSKESYSAWESKLLWIMMFTLCLKGLMLTLSVLT